MAKKKNTVAKVKEVVIDAAETVKKATTKNVVTPVKKALGVGKKAPAKKAPAKTTTTKK